MFFLRNKYLFFFLLISLLSCLLIFEYIWEIILFWMFIIVLKLVILNIWFREGVDVICLSFFVFVVLMF